MRILILSNAPWSGSGYGQQSAQLAKNLTENGHQVAIQAFYGINGTVTRWTEDIPVYPASTMHKNRFFGLDLTPYYMEDFKADLLLTLSDAWCFDPARLAKYHVAHWMPVDSMDLGDPDRATLRESGAIPVAMSRHGQDVLTRGGYPALYAPHGVDSMVFCPHEQRDQLRSAVGIDPDEFIIVMNSANMDLFRKAFVEQMTAFARFNKRHPKSRLLMHCLPDGRPAGMNLGRWARKLGIFDAVEFADDGRYIAGGYDPEYLGSVFYPVGDIISGCSRAEGFGLPLVEAALCGTPTVATNFSAMRETGAGGVLVNGEPFGSPLHTDFWLTPSVQGIEDAYEFYWQARENGDMPKLRAKAREFAMRYDDKKVFAEHWVPVLNQIEQLIDKPTRYAQTATYLAASKRVFNATVEWHEFLDRGDKNEQEAAGIFAEQRNAWNAFKDLPEQPQWNGLDAADGPDPVIFADQDKDAP